MMNQSKLVAALLAFLRTPIGKKEVAPVFLPAKASVKMNWRTQPGWRAEGSRRRHREMERRRRAIAPLRQVVKTKFYTNKYCRLGEGRIEHTLECGHTRLEKANYGKPRRMRCVECGRALSATAVSEHEVVAFEGKLIPVLGTVGGTAEQSRETARNIERFIANCKRTEGTQGTEGGRR